MKAFLHWPVPLAPIPVLSAALMGGFSTVELRTALERAVGLVPSHAAQAVQQACPTAQIVSLPGPHFLLQALPAESAAAVHRFLERLENAA